VDLLLEILERVDPGPVAEPPEARLAARARPSSCLLEALLGVSIESPLGVVPQDHGPADLDVLTCGHEKGARLGDDGTEGDQ
jgi:hypothetical protein